MGETEKKWYFLMNMDWNCALIYVNIYIIAWQETAKSEICGKTIALKSMYILDRHFFDQPTNAMPWRSTDEPGWRQTAANKLDLRPVLDSWTEGQAKFCS